MYHVFLTGVLTFPVGMEYIDYYLDKTTRKCAVCPGGVLIGVHPCFEVYKPNKINEMGGMMQASLYGRKKAPHCGDFFVC
jgi:hypothetical protein